MSHDFNHVYPTKINLLVYPDLQSFHTAISDEDAPAWVVAEYRNNRIQIVSPNNPGPKHSAESVMKSVKNGVVALFIQDKYPEKAPYWLRFGVVLFKSDYYSSATIKKLLDEPKLPTIEQLEQVQEHTTLTGFQVSFSMVQFIVQRWGWDAILQLLEDYTKFEELLQLSKKNFTHEWLAFLSK